MAAFTPESLKRQNELLKTLRQELAAKDRELASQKWLLDQYLQSPSWRLTYPLRWTAKQLRLLRNAIARLFGKVVVETPTTLDETLPAAVDLHSSDPEPTLDVKALISALNRTSLESFLATGVVLDIPRSSRPAVSIILVLFNRAELTLACLRSIREIRNEEFEVIIVDNASSDETGALLDRLAGARIIRNSENLNFLLAVNQAAREARGEYLLLLNNDAQLMPESLSIALRTARSATDIGAVGGKIVLLDGTMQEAGSIVWRDGSCLGYGRGDNPMAPMYMFRRDVDYCSGAFLLTPRALWEQLGGFDETFKPAYYEETDYCTRLRQAGFRIVYEPDCVIVHYEFASSESPANATQLQSDHQRLFEARHRAFLQTQEPADPNRIIHARTNTHGRRAHTVLFLDDRVPHLWLGSGFPRAHAFLRGLLKHGTVTFYPLTIVDEAWDSVYSDIPREIEVMTGFGRDMLEAFLRNRRGYYTEIVVSRPHNMNLLRQILLDHPNWFEDTAVIYDAEALFVSREIGLRKLQGNPMTDEQIAAALQEEINLASEADCVVSVSEREGTLFSRYGIRNVRVLGHSITTSSSAPSLDQRSGLLFVGAVHEEMSPNADSLVWFLTEVFPLIQKKLGNDLFLTIAGVNKSERIRRLAGPAVRITGHLPDLSELYSCSRVFIAPTRYAAGIPHKVHEAAARGLPVVATSLLASQLDWTERELAIADTAQAFADRCIDLYTNAQQWHALRNGAMARVQTECSQEEFERKIHDILANGEAENHIARSRFANAGMDR